jgi:hypothetical protein
MASNKWNTGTPYYQLIRDIKAKPQSAKRDEFLKRVQNFKYHDDHNNSYDSPKLKLAEHDMSTLLKRLKMEK